MRHVRQAGPIGHFTEQGFSAVERLRVVQRAPGPEAPDNRDKGGAQLGMVILMAGGAAFWTTVTFLVIRFLL
jgi:hypothetical protein